MPTYAAGELLLLPLRGEFDGDWRYEPQESTYRLAFKYYGPGVNECAYTPERQTWECGGYF